MTLADEYKYRQAMERVALSDEARARIRERLKQEQEQPKGGKVIAVGNWKRLAALAACLVLVVAGALTLLPRRPAEEPAVQITSGLVRHETPEALAAAVGFPAADLAALSGARELRYESIAGTLAQVSGQWDGRSAVLRTSAGEEDNSGDYNAYPVVREHALGGASVTLKGTEEGFTLALWQRDGYSYSLRVDPAAGEEELLAAVRALTPAA